MRKCFGIAVICCISFHIAAQDPTVKNIQSSGAKELKSLDSNGWRKTGTFILNLNQGALSNWVAGGDQNVLGINGIFYYILHYKNGKYNWDNFYDLALVFHDERHFSR